MGNDNHESSEATYLKYFGKKHLFHIVEKDFSLPENGIIGLTFFKKFSRYAITPDFLVLEKHKLPLHDDGEYIVPKEVKICRIKSVENHANIWIENQENIPDGIYTIKNNEIQISFFNYSIQPVQILESINYERINSIKTLDKPIPQIRKKLINKINQSSNKTQKLIQNSNLNHMEKESKEITMKILAKYSNAFTLPDDSLPYTSLTEHEITLNSGKIINLRSHKLPEKHKAFAEKETQNLLDKGIIRHSQSPFNSPLWILPKKGDKLRMVIDYRQINKDTDQEAHPLPMIDDILDQLGKAKFF